MNTICTLASDGKRVIRSIPSTFVESTTNSSLGQNIGLYYGLAGCGYIAYNEYNIQHKPLENKVGELFAKSLLTVGFTSLIGYLSGKYAVATIPLVFIAGELACKYKPELTSCQWIGLDD